MEFFVLDDHKSLQRTIEALQVDFPENSSIAVRENRQWNRIFLFFARNHNKKTFLISQYFIRDQGGQIFILNYHRAFHTQ